MKDSGQHLTGIVLKVAMELLMFPVRVIFWMMFAVLQVLSHLE